MTEKNHVRPENFSFRVVYVGHPEAIVQLKKEEESAAFEGIRLCCYTDVAIAVSNVAQEGAHLVLLDERSSLVRVEDFANKFHFSQIDHGQYFSLGRVVVVIPDGETGRERQAVLDRLPLKDIKINPLGLYGYIQDAIEKIKESHIKNNKITACIGGGAMDGYVYSIGVARALQECCESGWSLHHADILSGVSSGAIVAGLFALGLTPQDLEDTANNRHKEFKSLTSRTLFDLSAVSTIKKIGGFFKRIHDPEENLRMNLKHLVPLGVFHGDELEQILQTYVKKFSSGETFRHLKKQLYIGVTDQDTSTYVTFGDGAYTDVTISDAIRASMALPPFYPPKEINGHWYTEGHISGSVDFLTPIHHGSSLILCLTPMVPYRSEKSGGVIKRGGYFTLLQGLKNLVYSRFSLSVKYAMNEYPNVDFVFFEPKQKLMDKMSWNPMSYRLRTEIITEAMFATIEEIIHRYDILSYKLGCHGVVLKPKNVLEKLINM